MTILDCEQGGPEWLFARIGIPTASQFDRLLTPAQLKHGIGRSATQKYRAEILAEWVMGYPMEFGSSPPTERGTDMEDRARAWYELHSGHDVEQVGMVLRDDRKVGGSPDGIMTAARGGLELKVPMLHTHIAYLADPAELVKAYRGQVQGLLYLTGFDWWDAVSYSPTLPSVVERVEPDAEYHAALDDALAEFTDDLDEWKRRLAEHRQMPERSPLPGEESALYERLEASLEAVA